MTPVDGRPSTPVPRAGRAEVRAWLGVQVRAAPLRLGIVVALFVIASAAGLAGPAVLGQVVDVLVAGGDTGRVDLLALVFVAALLLESGAVLLARTHGAELGEAVLARTREGFLHHVLRLPLTTVERIDSGELLSRATSDVETLDEGVREAVPRIVAAALTLALTVVAMVLTSPLLSLVCLTTAPPLVLLTRWYRRRAATAYEDQLGSWAGVQSSTLETVTGGASVAALDLGSRRVAHHDRALDAARRATRRAVGLQTVYFPGLDLGVFLPMAVLLLVAGLALRSGLVGLGAVVAMVFYIERLADPLADVLMWLDELQLGGAALRRTLGVGLLEPDRPSGATRPHDREVRLHGVRFSYPGQREALRGVDLVAPAGRVTVVVGPSGAGKTTLGRLVAGVSLPTAGSVTVGQQELGALAVDDLRRTVVMVTQEHHVFDGTLRENLALPRPPAGVAEWTDRELWAALTAVDADGWVRGLDHGLDAPLDADSVSASNAQRLALARVVLADPPVVVLDEATSALDTCSARGCERSLLGALSGRTVLAVSHHLDIATVADHVAVVVDGRVEEQGRHDDLVAAGGSYARLWNSRTTDGTNGTHEKGEVHDR
ncbi:MAG: ABC transporter ATP-binding protein [Pseudonocardia sp.]